MKYEFYKEDGADVATSIKFENGHRLVIYWDEYCDTPRDLDNVGTMNMWHRRYNLPNEDNVAKPQFEDFGDGILTAYEDGQITKNSSGKEVVEQIGLVWFLMFGEQYLDNVEKLNTEKWCDRLVERAMKYINKNYVWYYVGMYDHSGLSFENVGSYNYGDWDSGVVGCHYVSMDNLKRWYPSCKGTKLRERGEAVLREEMNTFDNWQNGLAVGFKLLDEDGDEISSCWGFIADSSRDEDLVKAVAWEIGKPYFEEV